MEAIMSIFAEKILLNLVKTVPDQEESSRIISSTLEILNFYTGSLVSCRLIGNTDIMRNLIANGINTFQIL